MTLRLRIAVLTILSFIGLMTAGVLSLLDKLHLHSMIPSRMFNSSGSSLPVTKTDVHDWLSLLVVEIFVLLIPLYIALLRVVLQSIQLLKQAAKLVAAGKLNHKINVPVRDEFGELYDRFNAMTSALVSIRIEAENANPLTGLPGNRAIRTQIENRLRDHSVFAALYADLDNFKTFNDTYGIEAGDRAIRLAADILENTLREGILKNDFLGHEGGDDFVLVTTPERAIQLLPAICSRFDREIRSLYRPEDLERGHLTAVDREGNLREHPLITISIAVATNAHRPLTSYPEVTVIWAQVKRKVKQMSFEGKRSTFLVDRRSGKVGTAADRTVFPWAEIPSSLGVSPDPASADPAKLPPAEAAVPPPLPSGPSSSPKSA